MNSLVLKTINCLKHCLVGLSKLVLFGCIVYLYFMLKAFKYGTTYMPEVAS